MNNVSFFFQINSVGLNVLDICSGFVLVDRRRYLSKMATVAKGIQFYELNLNNTVNSSDLLFDNVVKKITWLILLSQYKAIGVCGETHRVTCTIIYVLKATFHTSEFPETNDSFHIFFNILISLALHWISPNVKVTI